MNYKYGRLFEAILSNGLVSISDFKSVRMLDEFLLVLFLQNCDISSG